MHATAATANTAIHIFALKLRSLRVYGTLGRVETRVPVIEILGIPVACVDRATALGEVERLYEADTPAVIAYANAHALNLAVADPAYHSVLRGADLVLGDGSGLAIAAAFRGRRFPANLNGSDFNPEILELAARRRWSVFFLGGRPGVADRAAARLRARIAGLDVVGTRHGFFDPDEDVAGEIRRSGAGIVMVALGNPKQELWLRDNLVATGACLGVGVGAFFDFSAGEVPRAPVWMRRTGIEWVWRLVKEPRRMWRRYVLGNPRFLLRALRDR